MIDKQIHHNTEVAERKTSAPESENVVAIERFLTTLFEELGAADFPYAVMRNFEGLPTWKSGNDIDIMVSPSHRGAHRELLRSVAERLGWRIVSAVEKPNIATYRVVSQAESCDTWPAVLLFDYFPGDAWYGARFVDADLLLHRRERHGSVWCLGLVDRVLCLVLHHLLCTGHVGKPRYRREIATVLAEYSEEFSQRLRDCVGGVWTETLLERLREVVATEASGEMLDLQARLRRTVVVRDLRRRHLAAAADWLRLVGYELRRRSQAPGLCVSLESTAPELAERITTALLPWLWQLDRRNHAVIGSRTCRLSTCSHKYAAQRVRSWYSTDDSESSEIVAPHRGIRRSLALGLVVLVAGDIFGSSRESQRGLRIVLAPDDEFASTEAEIAGDEDGGLGVRRVVFRAHKGVETSIAAWLAEELYRKSAACGQV